MLHLAPGLKTGPDQVHLVMLIALWLDLFTHLGDAIRAEKCRKT